MINTYIVDDENSAVELLNDMLSEISGINLTGCNVQPLTAINEITALKPDLLFLDVQLGSMTGFDLLNKLYENNIKPAVIFVTAYNEYAINALRQSAIDYLLKPIDEEELHNAIARYRQSNKAQTVSHHGIEYHGNKRCAW